MKSLILFLSLLLSFSSWAGPTDEVDLNPMLQQSERQSAQLQSKVLRHLKASAKANVQAESLFKRTSAPQTIESPSPILEQHIVPQRESLDLEKKNIDRFSSELSQ